MALFHVREAFALESRGLFVMAGSVVDGVVRPGMIAAVPRSSGVSLDAVVSAVEFLLRSDHQEEVCLCVSGEDDAELAMWIGLGMSDTVIDVA